MLAMIAHTPAPAHDDTATAGALMKALLAPAVQLPASMQRAARAFVMTLSNTQDWFRYMMVYLDGILVPFEKKVDDSRSAWFDNTVYLEVSRTTLYESKCKAFTRTRAPDAVAHAEMVHHTGAKVRIAVHIDCESYGSIELYLLRSFSASASVPSPSACL
jgi:hypothetical protein